MSLDSGLRSSLVLPAICPPMFLVSGPDLVGEACRAGIVGALPRANARTTEQFESWLAAIRSSLDEVENPGPLAVNFTAKIDPAELRDNLRICAKYGVRVIISATGNPRRLTEEVHDWGGLVFHDVTSVRFAEKAIDAGVDGVVCIGAGGGGHSGTVSHLALIPKVREFYDGTIIAAGAIATGAAVRAAEILGADLAYLGTRFIATQESMAHRDYKSMLVDSTSVDLRYVAAEGGVPANWLAASLARVGIDVDALDAPASPGLPKDLRYWVDVWSAGQGIDLIDDLPTVAELTRRLRREYVAACELSDMSAAARLANDALEIG
ncbi:nitronate monooxygenase [Pseudonocardia xishanensis]|uniref:Nitronate monooxygenase family protein n=1 Tax=Pseudonocardia xishanensis TaxID=630995 RepID=A0ABP8RZQ5_9PSEU